LCAANNFAERMSECEREHFFPKKITRVKEKIAFYSLTNQEYRRVFDAPFYVLMPSRKLIKLEDGHASRHKGKIIRNLW
jgi:hypothetical protein